MEDLNAFFEGLDSTTAEFLIGNSRKLVKGFFDNGFFDTSVGDVVLDTTQPRFTCKMSDLKSISRNCVVYINATKYTVIQIQPDGTGTATVLLAIE